LDLILLALLRVEVTQNCLKINFLVEVVEIDVLVVIVELLVDIVIEISLSCFHTLCFFAKIHSFVLIIMYFSLQVILFFLTFVPSFIFEVDCLSLIVTIMQLNFELALDSLLMMMF